MPDETYEGRFAAYYDRITVHKDYAAEVEALSRFVDATAPQPNPRILDVGCGTGTHAALLSGRGFDITAVEPSREMAKQAAGKAPAASVVCGEIADLDDTGFHACTSLFNVVNCLDSLDSLAGFFGAIAARLVTGAPLLVEAWNPIAVIAEPPERVERTYEDGDRTIRRTVVPAPDFLHQRLDLEYRIDVHEGGNGDGPVESFAVVHRLLLFTPLEIEFALEKAGFENIEVRTALPDLAPAGAEDRMLAITATRTGR